MHHGLGHLTRVFGTAPVEPGDGMRKLAELQSDLVGRTRLGIPAIAHEECLTGFTTLGATVFPTPLAIAATFDVELVEAMATRIGEVRAVGVHRGSRRWWMWCATTAGVASRRRSARIRTSSARWAPRTSAASRRGSSRRSAPLRRLLGVAVGPQLGPAPVGPREFQDVLLPPFERALRDGARSVMHSYSEVDGRRPPPTRGCWTDVLCGEWGFPAS